MQYILDQNEYDEYMELKSKGEVDNSDSLMRLLLDKKAMIEVRQLMLPSFPTQYKNEVMIKVDLEDLPDEAKDIVMSRVRRY